MTAPTSFPTWFTDTFDVAADDLELEAAFAIAVARIEVAVARHAKDPVAVISNGGSMGSRRAIKTSLAQLGFTDAQIRIVQRLLGGTVVWPGLLRLYLAPTDDVTPAHRTYVARQVREFRYAKRTSADLGRRSA